MRILLTAFNAFGSLRINPSQVIVEEYVSQQQTSQGCEILCEVLETSYALAEMRIGNLLEEIRPDVLLMFGVAQTRASLSIERQARNWDAGRVPDNTGELRTGQPIMPDGPAVYPVTISAEGLVNALRRESIPADLSDDAGAFVCNHTLYAALRQAERLGNITRCGFIHIPLPVELRAEEDVSGLMSFADLIRAVDVCLRFVRKEMQSVA